jgi:hypothetical protein
MTELLKRLAAFFKPATYPSDSDAEPAQITQSRVLLIVYDPVVDPATGAALSQKMRWNRPSDLVGGFISDLIQVSGGKAKYLIDERVDQNEYPNKPAGFPNTPHGYLHVLRGDAAPHSPPGADYYAILNKYKILQRVARNEIDEVWVFAFPHAGFYESIMAGPDAFWCNAPPLKNTEASKRRFVVMGFSFERHIGEMLEAYGHRAESIMEKTCAKLSGEANLWRRFIRYEKTSPGKAACGNIHFAPNSRADYDWGNPAPVVSECYDWLLNFPNFKGDRRIVAASEWGGGDMRGHHQWWFNHLPRVAGRKNGVHNNWWQYIVNPQQVIL